MRRRTAKKHIIQPDPKYKDVEVTKFVNSLMIDGKKNIAFNMQSLMGLQKVFRKQYTKSQHYSGFFCANFTFSNRFQRKN